MFVCFKGNNGHGADLSVCQLMTQSGHAPPPQKPSSQPTCFVILICGIVFSSNGGVGVLMFGTAHSIEIDVTQHTLD